MNFLLNRAVLDQTRFTSASPAGLACVAHAVAHEGEHELHLLDDGEVPVETVPVTITAAPAGGSGAATPAAAAPGAGPGTPSMSAGPAATMTGAVSGTPPAGIAPAATLEVNAREIGAARLRRGSSEPPAHHVVHRGAHLLVHTPAPQDGRRVRLVRKADGAVVFDSAALAGGDRFAVTLIRPGRYQVENQLTGQKLALTVEYPVVGKQPYRPPPPMQIECTAAGFHAPATTLKPAQGVIVVCSAPARLHIELVAPDDTPPAATDSRPEPPRATGTAHASLGEEARAVLHRVLRRFFGRRDH